MHQVVSVELYIILRVFILLLKTGTEYQIGIAANAKFFSVPVKKFKKDPHDFIMT